jgi:hypothetical protein
MKGGKIGFSTMRFFGTEEGRVFLLGCTMAILWIEVTAFLWHFGYGRWLDLLLVGLGNLLIGKAAGVAQGTQANVPGYLTVVMLAYTDAMFAFIVYPVFVFSYQHYFESRFFQRRMKPMLDSAQKNVGRFAQFKVAGVFLFVWTPFMMTGVGVGSILGYLLGLKTWVTLTTVVLATLTASIAWVYAFDRAYAWLSTVHAMIPALVTAAIIVALVVLRLFRKRGLREQKR